MPIDDVIKSLNFFSELAGVAMKYDPRILIAMQAIFERRCSSREKNTDDSTAKKGPKNLLAAAASVQTVAA